MREKERSVVLQGWFISAIQRCFWHPSWASLTCRFPLCIYSAGGSSCSVSRVNPVLHPGFKPSHTFVSLPIRCTVGLATGAISLLPLFRRISMISTHFLYHAAKTIWQTATFTFRWATKMLLHAAACFHHTAKLSCHLGSTLPDT